VDQDDIAAYRELHRNLTEASQNRDTFKQATLHLFHNLIVNQGYGDGVYEEKSDGKKLSRYEIACHHLNANIDMIYDYTESPIEKLFLCSLLTVAMRFSPFMIAITCPIVADVFPAKMSAIHQHNLDLKHKVGNNKFPEIWHVAEMFEILEELEPAAYSILPKHLDAIGRVLTNNMDYLLYGLGKSFHVSLQPTFEKVRVEGKSIRPDMMLWVPTRPDFKLIVECDGYQYHSDKEMFSKDRIRDRVLQQQGYQVFRFSGQEIVQNATLKANEFIDYLSGLADKFDLDMEKAQQEMNTFGADSEEQEKASQTQPRRKKKKKPSPQQKRQLRHAQRRRK
jgi:hypothetical protein